MKFVECDPAISTGIPQIYLKFYANTSFSDIFKDSIKFVIERFDGKYTGCYGCGRCNNINQRHFRIYP